MVLWSIRVHLTTHNLTSALKVSIRVTSQCSHRDVGTWCCGLLECALWSNTSDFSTHVSVRVTSQCSYMHHPTVFVKPVVVKWLEQDIAQWVHCEGLI